MSRITPYQRMTNERFLNRVTTIAFMVVMGLAFVGAKFISDKPDPIDPDDKTQVDSSDWEALIGDVKKVLQQSSVPEMESVRERLATVNSKIQQTESSKDTKAAILGSLVQIERQAAMLSQLKNRPPVNAEDIDDIIVSEIESVRLNDEVAIRNARKNAEALVRQKKDPLIREMRLSLCDQEDQVAELRRQIKQVQQEQAEFKAKRIRVEALNRDMQDVKRYLSPFISPGHLQPNSNRNAWDTERTADAQPVSLSRLKRLGALEPTMEGLERLYIFGGGKNAALNNSRPLGSFPQYWAEQLSKPEVLAAVKRAQRLLRDHGQALVEEQLLTQ